MADELTTRKPALARRRYSLEGNTMTFPRELRDAIPDLPTCVGRVLELAAVDVQSTQGARRKHVELRFEARETGKLDGVFTVRMNLDADAAMALATALRDALGDSAAEG